MVPIPGLIRRGSSGFRISQMRKGNTKMRKDMTPLVIQIERSERDQFILTTQLILTAQIFAKSRQICTNRIVGASRILAQDFGFGVSRVLTFAPPIVACNMVHIPQLIPRSLLQGSYSLINSVRLFVRPWDQLSNSHLRLGFALDRRRCSYVRGTN